MDPDPYSKTTKLILLDSLLQEIGDACLPPPPCQVDQADVSDKHLMHKRKWRIKWLTERELQRVAEDREQQHGS
jgi:hypothetical protein